MTAKARRLTMAQAISEAIGQEMDRDASVFVMGEDIGTYGGVFSATSGLLGRFGKERVRDTPISETAFIGTAIAAAAEGMRPIVELMFVDFCGVCMDEIYNHLAKNQYMSAGHVRMPVVVTTAIGGGYNDGTQHSQCLYSLFAHTPGLKIVVPSNAYDAKGLMIEAIRDDSRRGNAEPLGRDGVVQTARRAAPSIADGGDEGVDRRHLRQQLLRDGPARIRLAPPDHVADPVLRAQHRLEVIEEALGADLGIVEQAHRGAIERGERRRHPGRLTLGVEARIEYADAHGITLFSAGRPGRPR